MDNNKVNNQIKPTASEASQHGHIALWTTVQTVQHLLMKLTAAIQKYRNVIEHT